MADEELVRILKQGGDAWNTWRHQAGIDHVDFSKADLRGIDLKGADLGTARLALLVLHQLLVEGR